MEILLIILGVIVGILICISMCANLFNNRMFPVLPGFNIVDNADWISIIIFSIQFWDIASDINLSIEIWKTPYLFNSENMLILIAAIGSTACVIIPYTANLIIAANVKRIIKDNQAAKGWFQENTGFFTGLVVLCGGCYPALCVVSSCVFGLNITTCGLTQYELKQMGKIKVFGTVILENIPQLLFQALYAYNTGITDAVTLAFVASLLSVTASTLSYLIERDAAGTKAVQYYLITQCSQRQIIESEKAHFIANRGRTWALAEEMAEVFGEVNKNIEVGFSMITKHGVITHVVHFVSESDIEMMEEELKETVTPQYFTAQLYESLKNEINCIFRKHFGISDEFTVQYASRLDVRKRTGTIIKKKVKYKYDEKVYDEEQEEKEEQEGEKNRFSLMPPKNNTAMHKRHSTVLKKIATQIEMGKLHHPHSPITPSESGNENINGEIQVMMELNKFFIVRGVQNQQEKIDLLTQLLIQNENNNPHIIESVVEQEENKNDEMESSVNIVYEDC